MHRTPSAAFEESRFVKEDEIAQWYYDAFGDGDEMLIMEFGNHCCGSTIIRSLLPRHIANCVLQYLI